MEELRSSLASAGAILAAMALVAAVEAAIPLHARGRSGRAHLGPNLALTFVTFATSALLDAALVAALIRLEDRGFGLLRLAAPGAVAEVVLVVLALDLSFYLAHVSMHRIPAFWRFHRVHHCDPTVDVTTALRQHPGEGAIRQAFLAAFACALGASPGAFAVYRVALALCALLEHANLRLPTRLDAALSLVFTWPSLHKVHHSRDPRLTDTNYGNVVSWWDRLFATFTPARRGAEVAYGLDGFDDPALQTTAGLLALPFLARPAGRALATTSMCNRQDRERASARRT
jgi:sterol desaturase/sphingolipid hydroxylase (fatty acid hydroxylase superfamily)